MKTEIKLRMEMMGRAVVWLRANGIAELGSYFEDRVAEVETVVEELRAAAAGQDAAFRGYRQEAARRSAASAALQEWMADVARVARSLPVAQYPGVAEKFRMPRSQSYLAQQASASAFIKALRSLHEVFAERGFDEAAIAEAEAMIAEIETANGAKISNALARIHDTAALMLRSSHGLAIAREIDAILQRKLRANPALLAEWNSTRRVHRPWKKYAPKAPQPAAQAHPEEAAAQPAPEWIGGVQAGNEVEPTGLGSLEVREGIAKSAEIVSNRGRG